MSVPRVLLRSKLIPELEYSTETEINALDETAIKAAIRDAQTNAEIHDHVVAFAESMIETINNEYDLTSHVIEVDDEEEAEQKKAEPKKSLDLLATMKFISSGVHIA